MAVSIATSIAYAGCAGDCMTCHPKLKDNKDHLVLATCINCHDPHEKKNVFEFGTGEDPGGCGENCFECHDQWPEDGWHADLQGCVSCHKNFVMKK